jgi:CRP-like cAMP-binding protein
MTAKSSAIKQWKLNSGATRALLVGAQLSALLVFVLALIFLEKTTGGTLFLFSSVGPLLTLLATAAVAFVLANRFLRSHSLFAIEDIGAGQVIFKQGDEGDCAYFIHSGQVEVIKKESGADKVVATLSKGQYFGEMALISDEPRNATVRSATSVRLAVLGKQNFLTMLSLMPHTQQDIMQTVNQRAQKAD